MTRLFCDMCGKELRVENSDKTAVCDFCGWEHTGDRIKGKNVASKNSTRLPEETPGEKKQRLLALGDKYLSEGKLREAKKTFRQVTKHFPKDWRGWFGIVQSFPIEEYAVNINYDNDITEIIKFLDRDITPSWEKEYLLALHLAPEMSKVIIERYKDLAEFGYKKIVITNCLNRTKMLLDETMARQADLDRRISEYEMKDLTGSLVFGVSAFALIKSFEGSPLLFVASLFVAVISYFAITAFYVKNDEFKWQKENKKLLRKYLADEKNLQLAMAKVKRKNI